MLAPKVQCDVGLAPRRHPDTLTPLGNAPLKGGPDGILSFREKSEPEMPLIIGFRCLELIAFGGLQSYVSVRDGLRFDVQHLATNCAEACRRRSKAASGQHNAQPCS